MHLCKGKTCLVILLVIVLDACSNVPASPVAPLVVQYTFAAQPWLADVETCAGARTVLPELRSPDFQDLSHADMAMRIGEDSLPVFSTYQVGSEEIIVILNPENPLPGLSSDQVTGLFSGAIQDWQELDGSPSAVQVWVFPPGEDLQRLFAGSALGGLPVTSMARLAITPGEMITSIREDVNAIGLLTRRWLDSGIKPAYTAGEFPVLVHLGEEPEAGVQDIVACLQK